MNFVNNELLHPFDRVLVLKAEVELGGTDRFICGVVPNLKIWVIQCFFASNSLRRIKIEHPGQEIDCERVGMGNEGREGNPGLNRKRADILLGTGRTNTAESILRWSSQVVQNLVELINVTEKVSAFSQPQRDERILTPCP